MDSTSQPDTHPSPTAGTASATRPPRPVPRASAHGEDPLDMPPARLTSADAPAFSSLEHARIYLRMRRGHP